MSPNLEDLESFERAFSGRFGSCVLDCACGKTFWDAANDGYDWAEDESARS